MNQSSHNLKAISFSVIPPSLGRSTNIEKYRNWSHISLARIFRSSSVLSHRNIGMIYQYLRIQKLLLLLEYIIHIGLSPWEVSSCRIFVQHMARSKSAFSPPKEFCIVEHSARHQSHARTQSCTRVMRQVRKLLFEKTRHMKWNNH